VVIYSLYGDAERNCEGAESVGVHYLGSEFLGQSNKRPKPGEVSGEYDVVRSGGFSRSKIGTDRAFEREVLFR